MGRKPSVNLSLPPQMRARRRRATDKVFYYFDTGLKPRREIPLGDDYVAAVQAWAKLTMTTSPSLPTVGYAIARYVASDDYTSLGVGTQKDYKYAIDKLQENFGDAPLDQVKPSHLKSYLAKRGQESKHRAQREVTVLGMIFRWARAIDLTNNDPKEPVKLKKLPGRKNVYIHDDLLDAVYQKAPIDLKDAMDLAYFIGQRPSDLLTMTISNKRDGWLEYRQGKTGTSQRIAISGQFEELLNRIEARKTEHKVHSIFLVVNERGQKMTKHMLRSRFEKARSDAGISGDDFHFADLRRKSGSDLRDQVSLEAAQTLLGHKSVVMTEHYTGGRGKQISAIPSKKSKVQNK